MGHKNYSKNFQINDDEQLEQLEQLEPMEQHEEILEETLSDAEVVNCSRLYVRAFPSANAKPLCVIDNHADIKVNINKSTNEFFYVKVSNDITGYCMKDYIIVK